METHPVKVHHAILHALTFGCTAELPKSIKPEIVCWVHRSVLAEKNEIEARCTIESTDRIEIAKTHSEELEGSEQPEEPTSKPLKRQHASKH